jgi:hypothetical protein
MYVLVEHKAIQSKWLVNCRLYDSTLMSGSYEIHKASFNYLKLSSLLNPYRYCLLKAS